MQKKIDINNIDHIGIVVPNIEEAINHYQKNFNAVSYTHLTLPTKA